MIGKSKICSANNAHAYTHEEQYYEEYYFSALDIYFNLSNYEGYSLTTLEAMSLGVPVISSDLNGVFYDNKDKNLARVKDISDKNEVVFLTKKILLDNVFREQIIKSGHNIISNNSWSKVAKKYDMIYSNYL